MAGLVLLYLQARVVPDLLYQVVGEGLLDLKEQVAIPYQEEEVGHEMEALKAPLFRAAVGGHDLKQQELVECLSMERVAAREKVVTELL